MLRTLTLKLPCLAGALCERLCNADALYDAAVPHWCHRQHLDGWHGRRHIMSTRRRGNAPAFLSGWLATRCQGGSQLGAAPAFAMCQTITVEHGCKWEVCHVHSAAPLCSPSFVRPAPLLLLRRLSPLKANSTPRPSAMRNAPRRPSERLGPVGPADFLSPAHGAQLIDALICSAASFLNASFPNLHVLDTQFYPKPVG